MKTSENTILYMFNERRGMIYVDDIREMKIPFLFLVHPKRKAVDVRVLRLQILTYMMAVRPICMMLDFIHRILLCRDLKNERS